LQKLELLKVEADAEGDVNATHGLSQELAKCATDPKFIDGPHLITLDNTIFREAALALGNKNLKRANSTHVFRSGDDRDNGRR